MPSPKKGKGRSAPEPKGEDAPRQDRKVADWEAIEAQYRAGILSLRAIATQFDLTEGAIRKRAKAERWERALAGKVREAAREKLVRIDGTQAGTHCVPSDKEVTEQAAEVIVAVARDHRATIRTGRVLVLQLLNELVEVNDNREEIEKAIEVETESDKDNKRRERMLRAIALPNRAGVMLNLSAALKNVIALERAAFSMDDNRGDSDSDDPTVIVLPANGR